MRLPVPTSAVCFALALLAGPAFAAPVPAHNHVIVVIMENKSYNEVRTQPYVASLIANGASFNHSFAVTHPSQPNYFALWAGSTLGTTNDVCPAPGSPFAAPNLGQACEAAGKTWRAYSENLPGAGGTGCSYDGNTSSGLYTRKHDPWTCCSNLNHANERPYSDLAADIAANQLPNLAYVVPNNCNNTHNSSTAGCAIANGDQWLATQLPAMVSAVGPLGLVILTWDEDDSSAGNQVLTVFTGAQVIPGALSTRSITHYTLVRTIADALSLPAPGLAAGETAVDDVWVLPTAARATSWGHLKLIYR